VCISMVALRLIFWSSSPWSCGMWHKEVDWGFRSLTLATLQVHLYLFVVYLPPRLQAFQTWRGLKGGSSYWVCDGDDAGVEGQAFC